MKYVMLAIQPSYHESNLPVRERGRKKTERERGRGGEIVSETVGETDTEGRGEGIRRAIIIQHAHSWASAVHLLEAYFQLIIPGISVSLIHSSNHPSSGPMCHINTKSNTKDGVQSTAILEVTCALFLAL